MNRAKFDDCSIFVYTILASVGGRFFGDLRAAKNTAELLSALKMSCGQFKCGLFCDAIEVACL